MNSAKDDDALKSLYKMRLFGEDNYDVDQDGESSNRTISSFDIINQVNYEDENEYNIFDGDKKEKIRDINIEFSTRIDSKNINSMIIKESQPQLEENIEEKKKGRKQKNEIIDRKHNKNSSDNLRNSFIAFFKNEVLFKYFKSIYESLGDQDDFKKYKKYIKFPLDRNSKDLEFLDFITKLNPESNKGIILNLMQKLDDISAKNEYGEYISSLFKQKMTDLLHCYFYNPEKFTCRDKDGKIIFSVKGKKEFLKKKQKNEYIEKKRERSADDDDDDEDLKDEIITKKRHEGKSEDTIKDIKESLNEFSKIKKKKKYLKDQLDVEPKSSNRLEEVLKKYFKWS